MAYRIKKRESISEGLRRIAVEQIDHAVRHLSEGGPAIDDAVHEARKCFKKIRAVLRLVRTDLGDVYVSENAFYRDTGAALSAARDAGALIECLNKLEPAPRTRSNKAAYARIRQGLERRRDAVVHERGDLEGSIPVLLHQLGLARERVASWPLRDRGFDALAGGLKDYYRRGREAMRQARQTAADENFHEWRKRVKDHWYHGRVLEGIWRDLMRGHRRALKRLSGVLGDYHDLVVLKLVLAGDAEYFDSPDDVAQVIVQAEERQAALRIEAHSLGKRVYAEPPAAFGRRWRVYWRAWRRN